MSSWLTSKSAREGGRLEKTGRALYRLRFYPQSPFESIAAAWVRTDPDEAVVSHESALELYGLSHIAPSLSTSRSHANSAGAKSPSERAFIAATNPSRARR